jgi:hypothetical protein
MLLDSSLPGTAVAGFGGAAIMFGELGVGNCGARQGLAAAAWIATSLGRLSAADGLFTTGTVYDAGNIACAGAAATGTVGWTCGGDVVRADIGSADGVVNGNRSESSSVGIATAGSLDQARRCASGVPMGDELAAATLGELRASPPGEFHASAEISAGCCSGAALPAATVVAAGVFALCITGSGSPG